MSDTAVKEATEGHLNAWRAYRERLGLVQWHLDEMLRTGKIDRKAASMARAVAGNKAYEGNPYDRR